MIPVLPFAFATAPSGPGRKRAPPAVFLCGPPARLGVGHADAGVLVKLIIQKSKYKNLLIIGGNPPIERAMTRRPRRADARQPIPKHGILHAQIDGCRRLGATRPPREGAFASGPPNRILASARGSQIRVGTLLRDRACSRSIGAVRFAAGRGNSPAFRPESRRRAACAESHGETLPAAVATTRSCRLAETAISSHRPVYGEAWGDKRHALAAAIGAMHRRGPVDGAGPGRIRPRANSIGAGRIRSMGIDGLGSRTLRSAQAERTLPGLARPSHAAGPDADALTGTLSPMKRYSTPRLPAGNAAFIPGKKKATNCSSRTPPRIPASDRMERTGGKFLSPASDHAPRT